MSLRIHISLLCWSAAIVACWGQHTPIKDDLRTFYTTRAQADGLFEIGLVFASEKDEWDYWKDQRVYEREIYRQDPLYYTTYILAKRKVYAGHRPICGERCHHGDYFYIQSSFYLQFAEEDLELFTVNERDLKGSKAEGLFGH